MGTIVGGGLVASTVLLGGSCQDMISRVRVVITALFDFVPTKSEKCRHFLDSDLGTCPSLAVRTSNWTRHRSARRLFRVVGRLVRLSERGPLLSLYSEQWRRPC